MDLKRLLARRTALLQASGIRKIFDLAATLKDPVNFSIGQPDFPVPGVVKEAAIEAIRGDRNGYTPSGGIPELKEAVRRHFEARNGIAAEDVLIASGVSGGLTLALQALVEPGDEVLVPDPYFVSYKQLTLICGGTPIYYDTYPDFQPDLEALERLVTPRTKVLLAMSPGNPTGATLSAQAKEGLAGLARRKGLVLVSDEIYELFSYGEGGEGGGAAEKSLAAYYPEGTLAIGGLSKTVAMTGWRLGWVLGPRVLIQELTKLQQFTFVCAPSIAQWAALKAFGVDLAGHVKEYRGKRDLVVRSLRAAGYELQEPGGAFYCFPRVPAGYAGGQAFVEAAAARQLLLVPGNVFSERDTHFRISYAAPQDKLLRGLELLASLKARN